MASRYNSVYFFQHSLMNLPFVNINNIIHPNAENTPHPLLHFASAMYYNSQYWEDTDRVRADLEHESHYNDYKDSYMSYLSMMQTIYSLFTEGIIYPFYIAIAAVVTDICCILLLLCFYFMDYIIFVH